MAGQPDLTGVEISALGKMIYRKKIRPLMTEADIGKYVIVDVYSGEYEIDEWSVEADLRLRDRVPDAFAYMLRVGFSAGVFIGWSEEPDMAQPDLIDPAIAIAGKQIYQDQIRPLMTEADIGKYVFVDIHSGEYEIDDRAIDATDRLCQRVTDHCGYLLRVGFSAPYFIGWHEEPKL